MSKLQGRAMNNDLSIYYELLDLVDKQEEIIKKQNKMISDLVNKNMEQENLINELLRE